jgi:hypothetical protein
MKNLAQADYPAAAKFLGGLPTRDINVCAIWPEGNRPMASHSFMRNDAGIAGVEKFMAKYGGAGYGLYFYCNDLSVRLSKSKRPDGKLVYKAKENEVARVNMLHVDLDPPDGTKPEDMPAVKAAMIARAEAFNPAPTVIVNSGNGLGVFWRLDKPVKVTDENRDKLKGCNKALAEALQGDAAYNLDRVMRIPHTVNIPNAPKRRRGRVPVLASVVLNMGSLEAHSLDEFTSAQVEAGMAPVSSGNEYAGIDSPEIPERVDLSTLPPALRTLIEQGGPAGADRSKLVYTVACDLRRAGWSDGAIIHVLTNPDYMISDHVLDQKQRKPEDQAARVIDRMNRDHVKAAADADATQEFDDPMTRDAKRRKSIIRQIINLLKMTVEAGCTKAQAASNAQKAFDLAKKYKVTDEELAAEKTAQAGGQADATSGTSTSTDTADIHQPIPPNATWESLLRDYVYIGQQGQFVRREDGAMWNVDKFEKQFHSIRHFINPAASRLKTPPSVTSEIFDRGPNGMETFDTFCFMPGEEPRYKNAFNQWRKSPIEPKEDQEALRPWNEHLEYLFPDEHQRKLLLDWCAWVLQNPELHPNHALAMIGLIQGTGKTFVPTVLWMLLSDMPVSRLKQAMLERAHQTWMLRTKLAIVELRSKNIKVTDWLHDAITSPGLNVDIKGANDFEIPNVCAFWIESNKPDIITGMDNSDRRFLILSVDRPGAPPLSRKSSKYYEGLYGKEGVGGLIRDEKFMGAVAYSLLNRDLGDYSGEQIAPATEAKEEMQRANDSPLKQWMIDEKDDALRWHLLDVNDVRLILPKHISQPYNIRGGIDQTITAVLKGPPFYGEKLGRFRLGGKGGGDRITLWYLHRAPAFYSIKGSDGKFRVGKPPQLGEPDTRKIVAPSIIVCGYRNERRLEKDGEQPVVSNSLEAARAEFNDPDPTT